MANIVLTEAYNYVGTLNVDFSRNRDRWIFLLDSYVGGDDYRLGNYLVKYTNETGAEYQARCRSTPLDNHCRSVISVYISFLFREEPKREFGSIENDPTLEDFLSDADMDGRSFNAFMKEVSIWSSVFGHCWVLMTKPSIEAETLADQLAEGVRPYVNVLTPLVVTDWRWTRRANGRYDIVYFKYIEDVNDSVTTIREWTPDFIRTYEANNIKREALLVNEEINELGKVPVVLVYNERSQVRGIGISDITDIADQQRAIYNELSEVEQSVRLEGHPSLVVTPDTQVGAGAGAIIMMGTDLDPGLRPYMLNADATPINMIYESVNNRVKMIDRMANTGSVRGTDATQMSGIAMETEFQLLNAKLSEKADNLELAEEQLWNLYADYQGLTWDGDVEYPGSFNIRDTGREVAQLVTAKSAATDPAVMAVIDYRLLELLDEEPDEILNVLTTLMPPEPADPVAVAMLLGAEDGVMTPSATAEACPIATQDIGVNLANRQTAIDTAKYGPLNPALPNTVFWAAKADMWNTDVTTAKQSLCGNCSFFVQTTQILDCIDAGLTAGGATGNEWDSVGGGQLGYCEAFDFKCKSTRTCDAWVAGGPITDATPQQPGM